MLDLNDQEARKAGRDPLPVIGIALLLLDAVVAGEVEAVRMFGLQVRIGRGLAPGEIPSPGKWP